jgi:hypothetical protein
LNKEAKRKGLRRYQVNICDAFCSGYDFCKKKRKKLVLIDKSNDIIEDHLQVENIIRKLLDIELLKRIVLGRKRAMVFDEKFRYLNIGNVEKSMKYISQFEVSRDDKKAKRLKFDLAKFESIEENYDSIDINNYLITEYRDSWNI